MRLIDRAGASRSYVCSPGWERARRRHDTAKGVQCYLDSGANQFDELKSDPLRAFVRRQEVSSHIVTFTKLCNYQSLHAVSRWKYRILQ